MCISVYVYVNELLSCPVGSAEARGPDSITLPLLVVQQPFQQRWRAAENYYSGDCEHIDQFLFFSSSFCHLLIYLSIYLSLLVDIYIYVCVCLLQSLIYIPKLRNAMYHPIHLDPHNIYTLGRPIL